ncbi:LytTR family DNA-binding domain-containing protein [Raoultibacter phocaeensis]|uniref:LytTR family DNA-binding domain-containing protein n=1 Tax=Raoultibacter phocaeensis TaxID=2479841 RepID=UPI0011196708|nr:LytTR family DNA-binding domain-containing protein [Raoultibacter phocaeensis]
MRISINEERDLDDILVDIRCPHVDERVGRIVANLEAFDKRIVGKREGSTHLIDASGVLYVEAVDRRVFAYTADGVFECALRLYEAEDKLASLDFVRVSKQMIVNFAKVRAIRPDFNARLQLVLENGESVIVTRQYSTAIKKKIGAI